MAGLEDLYQDFSNSFVNFFGNQGALRHWLSGTTRTLRGVVEPRRNGNRQAPSFSLPPSPFGNTDDDDDDGEGFEIGEEAHNSNEDVCYGHTSTR